MILTLFRRMAMQNLAELVIKYAVFSKFCILVLLFFFSPEERVWLPFLFV